jgi:HNH endonuclease/NUMOD4 motif
MEIWKPVIHRHFENYQVSNLGRVKGPLKIRKPHTNRCGYLQVHLSNGEYDAVKTVHKLVASAFLGNPPRGKIVNHKDGNKKNPALDNLEYVSAKENMKHASRFRLMAFGERNNKAKLTDRDIRDIRHSKETAPFLAAKYKVHKMTIYRAKWRNGWPHIL